MKIKNISTLGRRGRRPLYLIEMTSATSYNISHRFSCDLCSYSTNNRGHFLEHQVTHTGERPYACPVCSKGFSTKSNMQRHYVFLHGKGGQID